MLEVYEGAIAPELIAELLARHQVTRPGQQKEQDLQRLPGQAHACSAFAELTGAGVQLERSKHQWSGT